MDQFSVRLRDLGSTNGTFVNGQRVQGQTILQPGDRIVIGKLEFEIAIHDSVAAVNFARAGLAPASGSNSDAGFMLNELAEMPEPAPTDETLTEVARTKSSEESSGPGETSMLGHDQTTLMPPAALSSESALPADGIDTSATLTEIPVNVEPALPTTQAIPAMQPAMPAAMAPQGTPMPGAPMMPPYGMPGAYPQPTYLQAPYANYPPQYMPNPYGMQQPFMPQPGYMDPAYQQQMAYQQAMAQQAMMAQYAAPPVPVAAAEVEEPEAPSKFANTVPISLPPPEETGVKPLAPPPPPRTEGTTAVVAAEVPNRQVAADIIKKLMNRG
jgi:predicted component of type VI protein secretion system